MKKKKIVFVCPYFYPNMLGGIQWYIYNISEELIKKGYEIHVLTQKEKYPKEMTCKGIKIHRLKSFGAFYFGEFWIGLEKKLDELKPDLIHCFDYAQTSTWKAVSYADKNRIPSFVSVYDMQSEIPRQGWKDLSMLIFEKLFMKKLASKTNLLPRSHFVVNELRKLGVNQKMDIVPPGITKEELKKGNAASFRKKFKIKKRFILYVGRIRNFKGVSTLLDSFEELKKHYPEIELVYIGSVEEDAEDFAKKAHYDKGVRLLGHVSMKDKINAMATCEMLVLPSGYEGFGQVLLQAMAQSKPVIGSNAAAIPYVIDEGKDGLLFEYENSNDLAKKIKKLLYSKKLREKMGKEGRKKAEKYTYDKLCNQLVKIYNKS